MAKIFWTGYCNDDRNTAINKIQKVISKYGDLIDFKFYSDISINMVIEIKEFNIDKLKDELLDYLNIDQFGYLHTTSLKERIIFLNITFTNGTGKLKIETPSVPG